MEEGIGKERRIFTDATKFKIVIEAIKGQSQISEIESDYEVHSNQIIIYYSSLSDKTTYTAAQMTEGSLIKFSFLHHILAE